MTHAILLALSMLAQTQPPDELKVRISGMNWPVGWGARVQQGLNRLEGVSSIDLESFKAGTGTYVLSFEKGLKVKPSDVGKSVAPFKLAGSGASLVRKIVHKDGAWMAGNVALANKFKKGDRDFEDLVGEVAGLVKSGKDTLKVTGDLEEGKKGELTLKLTAVKVVYKN